MKISRLLGQSAKSISQNKVRSGLTVLGIVIGIAAVIALLALGKGLSNNVTRRISALGTTTISIRSQEPGRERNQRNPFGGGRQGGGQQQQAVGPPSASTQVTLTEADLKTVQNTPHITAASPEITVNVDEALTANADTTTTFNATGVNDQYFTIQKLTVSQGSLFTTAQISGTTNVIVLGKQASEDIFGAGKPAVGQTVYLTDRAFTVIGVLNDPENASPFNNPSNNIYMPYTTAMNMSQKDKFSTITATADQDSNVKAAGDAIKQSLLTNHNISDATKADFGVQTAQDLLSTANNVTGVFTTVLAGIAAISLLVGGIGIMNIMLVTVTERTREIGLRRAVGAKKRHIIAQILVEATMLTLIGGLLGIVFGKILAQVASKAVGITPSVDAGSVILALVVSSAIGIIFGLFPAIKAGNLDPVEALRYE